MKNVSTRLPDLTKISTALDFTAPEVPGAVSSIMPDSTENFSTALLELAEKVLLQLRPELADVYSVCAAVFTVMVIVSTLSTFSGAVKKSAVLMGTVLLSVLLVRRTHSLIALAAETVQQLSDYGKLLWPVMTAALAAQGGTTASAALYAGTTAFDILLSGLIAHFLVPLVYVFLILSIGNCAAGEGVLKSLRDFIKMFISWCLKIILTIFTTYISITGVVSGSTDAAALKATKVTISSVVPVVGGILSDASEAVLVTAGLMKNAAGVYGMIAVLALFLNPFLRIGLQYLLLKATAALGGIFSVKEMSGLAEDFGTAMGLLLAMTGSVCLLLLISLFCFMKGMG